MPPSESTQHKLDRIRSPRVHITYDVEVGGAIQLKELPFVVGVLADLSGKPDEPLPRLKDRTQASRQDQVRHARRRRRRGGPVKAAEVHGFEDARLVEFVGVSRREVFNLRFQHSIGQLENTARLGLAKRDLARALTVARERGIDVERELRRQRDAE